MNCPICKKEKSTFIIKIFGECWSCHISTNIKHKTIEKTRNLDGWLKEHNKKAKK